MNNDCNELSPGFRAYLRDAELDHKFARDFAGDALADTTMPEPGSWDELAAYLRRCGACREAFAGAKIAWGSYREAKMTDRGGGKAPVGPTDGPALAKGINANTHFRTETLARTRARKPAPPRARRMI